MKNTRRPSQNKIMHQGTPSSVNAAFCKSCRSIALIEIHLALSPVLMPKLNTCPVTAPLQGRNNNPLATVQLNHLPHVSRVCRSSAGSFFPQCQDIFRQRHGGVGCVIDWFIDSKLVLVRLLVAVKQLTRRRFPPIHLFERSDKRQWLLHR